MDGFLSCLHAFQTVFSLSCFQPVILSCKISFRVSFLMACHLSCFQSFMLEIWKDGFLAGFPS